MYNIIYEFFIHKHNHKLFSYYFLKLVDFFFTEIYVFFSNHSLV